MNSKVSGKTWVFPAAIAISIGYLVLYVVLGLLGVTSHPTSADTIGDVSRWCERISGGIFREPVNALSNLGFMLAGLLMFRVLTQDPPEKERINRFHGITPLATLYAATVVYLGPGSMLMHGTHTDWGRWADNLSMVMYILLPWLINVGDMGRWTPKRFFATYASIILTYAATRWFFGTGLGINLDLFAISIALWTISEVLFRYWSPQVRWLSGFAGFGVAAIFGIFPSEIFSNLENHWWVILFWLPAVLSPNPPLTKRSYAPWFLAGMLSYLFAFAIWLQGYPATTFCDPDSLLQPHGIWHLMTAFSTWCFFLFLRSERGLD